MKITLKKIKNRIARILFQLFSVDSLSLCRIHKRNDLKEYGSTYGGWVVPVSKLNEDSVVYCVGCGEDITFDLGLIDAFSCSVHGFDPTPRAIQHAKDNAGDNSKYTFHEYGLWDCEDTLKFFAPKNLQHVSHSLLNLQKTDDYIEVKVKSLQQIMKELGHKSLDLLKIDIEGAEYRVLHNIIRENIKIEVICVEYDEYYNPLDDRYIHRIRASVNDIVGHGYDLVCAQGNGNYTFVKKANKAVEATPEL
ncbi:MAG: FkbM family methyltransferase [Lentimonas sp.]|jgi:FkbM family methyltransferase